MNEQPINKKLRKCNHCGKMIAKSAKRCPHCGGRKPFYQRVSFWIFAPIAFFLMIGIINGLVHPASDTVPKTSDVSVEQQETISATAKEMTTELSENALKAKEKYLNKYVELSGVLSTIDSDGKYISVSSGESFDFSSVQCDLKTDEQKEKVKELKRGDEIKLLVKITTVGEIFGYFADIVEFMD